ncbi:MAG: NAD-dependent epimerase/dehydratase family protein [Opitutaceae bacterium]|jgi:UDP-glucose 4-epimerase|nr:NAD-dependent epimerase/dehydratase family protein [Opitutaceae bacterium]
MIQPSSSTPLRKALVTGGAGFIGGHLVRTLLEAGTEVVVLDNFRTGSPDNLAGLSAPGARLVRGCITDRAAVRDAVRGCDAVFHLAALVSVPESMERIHECVTFNVTGLLTVLEEAAAAGARKLVLSSSAAVYGDDPEVPKREDMRPAPKSPYAITKLDGEYYCALFAAAGRIETASLRYFNVFGPRQNPSSAYAAAVPIFIRRALAGQPVAIHGDGGQTRDFVYVRDVVAANLFAASTRGLTGVFNVGYGGSLTILELAQRIIAQTGSASRIVHKAPRPGDIRHSRASAEKLLAAGWTPGHDLDRGLAETLAWYRQRQ